MVRAYYATTDVAGHRKDAVVLLDDDDQEQAGLIQSGYFERLPEVARGAVEGPDRA